MVPLNAIELQDKTQDVVYYILREQTKNFHTKNS